MVHRNRLIKPQDSFEADFPKVNFRNVFSFRTSGEEILVTDPTFLADVYNSEDEIASWLRARGVFIYDFGGDSSAPIWWQPPFVLIPVSGHYEEEPLIPSNVEVLSKEVGTDSGSFIFLPLTDDLPELLKVKIDQVLSNENGAALKLPGGQWTLFYEQWNAELGWPEAHFRNIVLHWQPD